jgi:hypothetical protein
LLSTMPQREQQIAEVMIRKHLLIKIGHKDPKVVANDYKASS